MNTATAKSLMNTMIVLKFADSLMPTTRIVVTSKIPTKATMLKTAVVCGSTASVAAGRSVNIGDVVSSHLLLNQTRSVPGVLMYFPETVIPKSESNAATVP